MDLEFNYNYEVKLCLAGGGGNVLISDLQEDISRCIKVFNGKSLSAKNKKKVVSWEVVEDQILKVTLSSANSLENPTRGLYLLSQLLIDELVSKGREDLVNLIIHNKSFFRTVSYKEVPKESDKIFEILENPLPNSFTHKGSREIFIALTELIMKPAYTEDEKSRIVTIRRLLGLDDNGGRE